MFKYLGLAMNILPMVVSMMAQIEAANADGKWTGKEKKELVMTGLKSAIQGMLTMSTGGQLTTWERIAPALSSIVDQLVIILFPKES